MVLDVRGGGGGRRHVLAILPGSRKLDFAAVATLFEARKCGFASPETAQELTGCVMGAVPPFALNPDLAIVVEEDLLANETLFFNAGRLDRSMELDTKDWLAVAKPRVARIAATCLTDWRFGPVERGRLRAAAGAPHRGDARASGTRLPLQALARARIFRGHFDEPGMRADPAGRRARRLRRLPQRRRARSRSTRSISTAACTIAASARRS